MNISASSGALLDAATSGGTSNNVPAIQKVKKQVEIEGANMMKILESVPAPTATEGPVGTRLQTFA